MVVKSLYYQITEAEKLAVQEECLDLASLRDNQVAAQTLYTAISPGTETAAFSGAPPLRPMKVYPRLVGYCNVARIVAAGSKVSSLKVDDTVLSFQPHRSSYVCDADEIILRIPPEASLPEAATTYLFHLGYNALLKGDYKPGHSVAIIGLGTLGLTAACLANLFGARTYAFSNQKFTRNLMNWCGAGKILCKDEDSVSAFLQDSENKGADLVISTSNSWDDWELALRVARKGGTVAVLGFPGRSEPLPDLNPLDSRYFYDKQLKLVACGYTPDLEVSAMDIRFTIKRNCKFLLDLILTRKIDARQIVKTVPWTDLESVYREMVERRFPAPTCVLDWESDEE